MRYFIGFLITIGLIVLLIMLLFGGGDNKSKVPSSTKTLDSYATSTDSNVTMTINGPVVADQEHDAIRITVSQSEVAYEQIRGYQDNVVSRQSFPNNTQAYTTFLKALGYASFTKGDTDPTLKDERGHCSTGTQWVFDLNDGGDNLEHYWTSSCGKPKTFLGSTPVVTELFEDQVPGYADLTSSLDL